MIVPNILVMIEPNILVIIAINIFVLQLSQLVTEWEEKN